MEEYDMIAPCKWFFRLFVRLTDVRMFAYGLAFALPVFGAFMYSSHYGVVPEPEVMDEFAYLLAADTFARGRLTNSTHPLWVHFETHHVIQTPTYSSKYPPAQGAILAVGQLIGHPVYGVWLSVGLMCVSLLWMLRGFMAPKWAFVGAMLCAMNLGIFHYWAQSYWGGAMAATGGALAFGGVRRLWSQPGWRNAILCGAGFVLLMFSRPFEGLFFALTPGVVLVVACFRHGILVPATWKQLILPFLLVCLAGCALLLIHNHAVTGSFLRMPYKEYESQYSRLSVLQMMKSQLPESRPHFRHAQMERLYDEHILGRFQNHDHFWRVFLSRIARISREYLGPILSLLLLFGVIGRLKSWSGVALVGLAVMSLTFVVNRVFFHPHYFAPAGCLLFLLVMQGMRRIFLLRVQLRPIYPALFVLLAVAHLAAWAYAHEAPRRKLGHERRDIEQRLLQHGENHVVIVEYLPDYHIHIEWIYNEADIDGAAVIWARDMGHDANQALLEYFSDRKIWLFSVGPRGNELRAY